MNRFLLASGSVMGALAVILGAFGAHALKTKIEADQLAVYETGVRYQFYHALALLACGILSERIASGSILYAGYFFLAGIILFSGSVYLLSLRTVLGIESWKFLGPVTPLGGVCFVAGWVVLLFSVLKK